VWVGGEPGEHRSGAQRVEELLQAALLREVPLLAADVQVVPAEQHRVEYLVSKSEQVVAKTFVAAVDDG
jgi:hypothetical protein